MSCIYIFKCIGSSLSYRCSVNFNIADFISIICGDRECCTFTFCNRYLAICKTFCCDRTAFTCCCCDIIRLNCNVLWCNFKFIKLRCTAVIYRLSVPSPASVTTISNSTVPTESTLFTFVCGVVIFPAVILLFASDHASLFPLLVSPLR